MAQSSPNHLVDQTPGHTSYLSGGAGRAYNQPAFRHFLEIERRRASRTGHCLLLVLVDLRGPDGRSVSVPYAAASRIFAVIGATVREVDFVGWFKHDSVAAAALVQRTQPSQEVRQQIANRLLDAIKQEHQSSAGRTRVRVVPIRGKR